jgi:hypothetical protein
MKIFEFVDSVQSIIAVAELVKNNSKDGTAPMADFLYALKNAGISMDYDKFKTVYDSNLQLKNSIQQFDAETVTFVGGEPEADTPAGDIPPDEKVGQMAKRAMNKREGIREMDNKDLKAKIDRLEDQNQHGQVALELAKAYGTELEVNLINAINAVHQERGSIEIEERDLRDSITRKYYKKMMNMEGKSPHKKGTAKYKKHMAAKHANMDEGYYEMPPMDRDKYQERPGLEGPFQTRSGKVVYYDPKEGSYYDPTSDMYLSYKEFMDYDQSKPEDFKIAKIEMPNQRSAPKREDTMEAILNRFKPLIK